MTWMTENSTEIRVNYISIYARVGQTNTTAEQDYYQSSVSRQTQSRNPIRTLDLLPNPEEAVVVVAGVPKPKPEDAVVLAPNDPKENPDVS